MQTLRGQLVKAGQIKTMVGANGLLSHNKPQMDGTSAFNCKVRLLDEEQRPLIIKVNREWIGRQLFEEICREIGGLLESDYFGLRYLDRKGERQWLDLRTNIHQQLKYTVPCVVSFRVKHYPPKPLEDLRQDMSRYFLYLQLRRDLQHGRLLCSPTDAQELAACVAQAELGDQCNLKNPPASITELRLLPNLTPPALSKIVEMHAQMNGCVPVSAESDFLEKVSKLDTYGVDPYPVKDQKGNTLYLGLTHEGVATFRGNRRSHLFKWNEITKFSYERRIFIIHVTLRDDTPPHRKLTAEFAKKMNNKLLYALLKKHVLGFKCQSRRTAAAIWRWAIDRHYFFTLAKGDEAKRHRSGGGFLRRGNTFRFSGRCREETLKVSQELQNRPQPTFQRSSSCRYISRRQELDPVSSSTLPRAHSEQHSTFPNGSAFPRTDGGTSVQFLMTSTPVKSRPTLLLHNSADELSGDRRERGPVRELSVDDKTSFRQTHSKGISEPDLSQTADSQLGQDLAAVAVSRIEVASALVPAPVSASQVSIASSVPLSADQEEVVEVMPRTVARRVEACARKPASVHSVVLRPVPLAQPEDLTSSEDEAAAKPVPVWKAAAAVLFVFALLCVLGAVLVFEGELHSSALHGLRASAGMESLYTSVYEPLRRRVLG